MVDLVIGRTLHQLLSQSTADLRRGFLAMMLGPSKPNQLMSLRSSMGAYQGHSMVTNHLSPMGLRVFESGNLKQLAEL